MPGKAMACTTKYSDCNLFLHLKVRGSLCSKTQKHKTQNTHTEQSENLSPSLSNATTGGANCENMAVQVFTNQYANHIVSLHCLDRVMRGNNYTVPDSVKSREFPCSLRNAAHIWTAYIMPWLVGRQTIPACRQ